MSPIKLFLAGNNSGIPELPEIFLSGSEKTPPRQKHSWQGNTTSVTSQDLLLVTVITH
jgi:hypothetical protein